MYFGYINDDELLEFHNTVRLTASYSELNSLKSGALFDKSEAMKLLPLFYSDEIIGYSERLTIIDDLIVLYRDYSNDAQVSVNDLDKLYFSSEDINREFDVLHETVLVNGKFYLKLHFYDKVSLFSLSAFSFNITQSDDGIKGDYSTDIFGNSIIPLTNSTGRFTVIGNELKQVIEWSQ